MKLRICALAIVVGCLAVTAPARVQWRSWSLTAGVVLPTNSEMRQIFGDTWFGIGISPSNKDMGNRWSLATDIGLTTVQKNGSQLFLLPVSAGIGRAFDQKDSDWSPYIAARVGATYINYAITRPSNHVRYRDQSVGLDANAEVGVVYKKNLRLSARYDWYSTSNSFNFDGMTLGISWTIIH